MEREQLLQYKFDIRHNDQFLNKAIGGVWDHKDQESLKKRKESMKGFKHTPEWIAWVTDFHRTRKRSPETNKRIGESRKGKNIPWETRMKISASKTGYRHSEETKALMSLKHIGNKSNTGRKLSESTKEKMRKSSKHSKNKLVSCPNCGKVGGEGGMVRWHFDKCKNK